MNINVSPEDVLSWFVWLTYNLSQSLGSIQKGLWKEERQVHYGCRYSRTLKDYKSQQTD